MKWLATLAILSGCQPTIIDGDTIRLSGERIRLVDYDAPELFHPRCATELLLAREAKRELRSLRIFKLDFVPCATRNYGRACARAFTRDEPVARIMISKGLGAPYDGLQPKRNWCNG